MSYRKSWSKTFKVDEFNVDVPTGNKAPFKCTQHLDTEGRSMCFRADNAWFESPVAGTWHLKVPVNLKTEMPGTNHKILTVHIKGLYSVGWGTWYHGGSDLFIYLDGVKIWEYGGLSHGNGQWDFNDLPINQAVTGNEIDLRLFQHWAAETGTIELHDAELKLDMEYYSETPPETATVKLTVANSQTGGLVKGAYVALMSGARIVASGYTDDGNVVFNNIEEGSYTVKVLAGGYYDFEQSIDVEPPSVWYTIKIVPIPVTPVPTWVYWAVGGVAALGAVTVIPSLIRRKGEEERVVVVK